MIIIGYQGIGKTTVSTGGNGYIDLESGNFWVNGKRDEKWYIPYCNIAGNLSEQGYNVFVSSHAVVREQLRNSNQRKLIVCPSLGLKDAWIERLRARYDATRAGKDYRALMNAEDRYVENISVLLADDAFEHVVIQTMPYGLIRLIQGRVEKETALGKRGGGE